MKTSLAVAAIALLLAGPAFAQTAQPAKQTTAIERAANVGACNTNLYALVPEYTQGREGVKAPLYLSDPEMARECANRIGSGTAPTTEATGQ